LPLTQVDFCICVHVSFILQFLFFSSLPPVWPDWANFRPLAVVSLLPANFWKLAYIFRYFFPRKRLVLTKNGLGDNLGNLFS
jgi:hypothetical protein